jgi:hypothetical protein
MPGYSTDRDLCARASDVPGAGQGEEPIRSGERLDHFCLLKDCMSGLEVVDPLGLMLGMLAYTSCS